MTSFHTTLTSARSLLEAILSRVDAMGRFRYTRWLVRQEMKSVLFAIAKEWGRQINLNVILKICSNLSLNLFEWYPYSLLIFYAMLIQIYSNVILPSAKHEKQLGWRRTLRRRQSFIRAKRPGHIRRAEIPSGSRFGWCRNSGRQRHGFHESRGSVASVGFWGFLFDLAIDLSHYSSSLNVTSGLQICLRFCTEF